MKETKNSLFPYGRKIDLTGKEGMRYYRFPANDIIAIKEPQSLIVSDNGHRIVDGDGRSHYIPYGWIHLYWDNIGDRAFFCEESKEEQARMTSD